MFPKRPKCLASPLWRALISHSHSHVKPPTLPIRLYPLSQEYPCFQPPPGLMSASVLLPSVILRSDRLPKHPLPGARIRRAELAARASTGSADCTCSSHDRALLHRHIRRPATGDIQSALYHFALDLLFGTLSHQPRTSLMLDLGSGRACRLDHLAARFGTFYDRFSINADLFPLANAEEEALPSGSTGSDGLSNRVSLALRKCLLFSFISQRRLDKFRFSTGQHSSPSVRITTGLERFMSPTEEHFYKS
ncbi:unnamed protein product [Protopolystoma xenopodis]|uniref:Uncharacterized protein n=1 Tax=Protopolystoma xenopodis TaxID=117903 RepID=A0A3S5FGS5_9PLAT|nr:unnamed protein product [Protopolystoma xenopodis]